MGIMYKLMKHRNLNVDFNEKPLTKTRSDKCRLLTMDNGRKSTSECDVIANDIDAAADHTSNAMHKIEGEVEKRFTAEHILQLCKFLAEKSKRNKNLHKKQQSPKKLTKSQKTFQFQPMDCNDDDNGNDTKDKNESSGNDGDDDGMVTDYDGHYHDEDIPRISYQNQALPLLNKARKSFSTYNQQKNSEIHQQQQRQQQQQQMSTTSSANILSSRLSPDINALNISSAALNQQQNNHQQYLRLQQQQHLGDHHMEEDPQQQHNHEHQQQAFTQSHHHHHHQHNHQQGKRDILLKIRHQIFERKRLREKAYEGPHALNATTAQVWRPW
ncbi:holes in muscle [Haematobia irritans]|uniref:holes in muscle n=1 Tax=Haematobia irritans TaxID=7368 RepID=UPI003F502A47